MFSSGSHVLSLQNEDVKRVCHTFLLGRVTTPFNQIFGFQLATHFALALLQNALGNKNVTVAHCA